MMIQTILDGLMGGLMGGSMDDDSNNLGWINAMIS